jgi:release factor glutamine methyltransferase
VHSDLVGVDATLHAYTVRGLRADVAERERGPLGPLVRGRRAELEAQGVLEKGQDEEDVLILRGRAA